MKTLELFDVAKYESKSLIEYKYLYIANIIKKLFSPLEYKNICEIGAGNFELAVILADMYERIDAHEAQLYIQFNNSSPNLHVCGAFTDSTNVSNHHLLLSISPYYTNIYADDSIDIDDDTKDTIIDVLEAAIKNNISLFLVLPILYWIEEFLTEIKNNKKYIKLLHSDIDLHSESGIYNHKVLIYKK